MFWQKNAGCSLLYVARQWFTGRTYMKISMICFSLTGFETGIHLKEALMQQSFTVSLDKKSKYLPDSISESTMKWAGRQFEEADALIFIGACGIAVRSIAPYIVSKKQDPAVLVLDECGKFVISLLSGHLGGANELTQTVAEILGAQPVVTTATDLHKRFAVDVFAKKSGRNPQYDCGEGDFRCIACW